VQLSNPRQERARAALSLEQLTKAERKTVAFHLLRFTASLQQQRRFDSDVAAALERSLRAPDFRERIIELLSPKRTSHTIDDSHRARPARNP
jgi:hypothetical protein